MPVEAHICSLESLHHYIIALLHQCVVEVARYGDSLTQTPWLDRMLDLAALAKLGMIMANYFWETENCRQKSLMCDPMCWRVNCSHQNRTSHMTVSFTSPYHSRHHTAYMTVPFTSLYYSHHHTARIILLYLSYDCTCHITVPLTSPYLLYHYNSHFTLLLISPYSPTIPYSLIWLK